MASFANLMVSAPTLRGRCEAAVQEALLLENSVRLDRLEKELRAMKESQKAPARSASTPAAATAKKEAAAPAKKKESPAPKKEAAASKKKDIEDMTVEDLRARAMAKELKELADSVTNRRLLELVKKHKPDAKVNTKSGKDELRSHLQKKHIVNDLVREELIKLLKKN